MIVLSRKSIVNHRIPLILIILLSLLLFSCSEDESTIQESLTPPTLESILVPDRMALNSDYFFTIQAIITGNIEGVFVIASISQSSTLIADGLNLFDDANAIPIDDGLEFTGGHSGDVVAGDGIFSIRVNSLFATEENLYTITINAFDADSTLIGADFSEIDVYLNQAPQMTTPNLPDTLYSGFSGFNLESEVSDAQGYSDIAEVWFTLSLSGMEYEMSDPEEDGIFSYYMSAEFGAGKYPGSYQFSFLAKDSLGAVSIPINLWSYIQNTPPTLANPSIISDLIATYPGTADSVLVIPDPGDTVEVRFTVDVQDLQTLADIDLVFLNVERSNGEWTLNYPLADNGYEWDWQKFVEGEPYLGDEIAGDGIFTTTRLYTSSVEEGIHTFHFHCIDKVNQQADSISVKMRITN